MGRTGCGKASGAVHTVLIVDDDTELCALIKKCAEQRNYAALVAHDGKEALRLIGEHKHSAALVILDVMLPDIGGFQVLRKMRDVSTIPVLMLTAKSSEHDKVFGLRLGADDYLTKPFSINELMARINALIRRYTALNPTGTADAACITAHGMTIDTANRTLMVHEVPVAVTGKEFDVLVLLASHKGRVFTKRQIYTAVWEHAYAFDEGNLMAFISKLRKKVEPDPDRPFYIQTVRGVGYRFNQEA
ncbi:MAG: response regulator transcription factor [Treponema sp.]